MADIEKTESDYQHFLSYSGLFHSETLRYVYFHGADIGLDRPKTKLPEISEEDKCWLSDNPNTSDIVEWIQNYANSSFKSR